MRRNQKGMNSFCPELPSKFVRMVERECAAESSDDRIKDGMMLVARVEETFPTDLATLIGDAMQGKPEAMFDLAVTFHMDSSPTSSSTLVEKWYRMSAEAGHRQAMLWLAMYLEEQGDKGELARMWYQAAADAGEDEAKTAVARLEIQEDEGEECEDEYEHDNTNSTTEIAKLKRAAEAGDIRSMHRLANRLEHSQEDTRDMERAIQWRKLAAMGGEPNAMFRLASCLEFGRGVPANSEEAEKWYRAAAANFHSEATTWVERLERHRAESDLRMARNGDIESLFRLGHRFLDGRGAAVDWKKASHCFLRAARSGHHGAMTELGACFQRAGGVGLVVSSPDEAKDWLTQAAEAGHLPGMVALANFLTDGTAQPPNLEMAFAWYERAAQAGLPIAMYHLAHCYEIGAGINEDQRVATNWYREAGEAGHVEAMVTLAERLSSGKGVDATESEATQWYKRAAENGAADAMYELANRLQRGTGTPIDLAEAFAWYRRLAELESDPRAWLQLRQCYKHGRGVQRNPFAMHECDYQYRQMTNRNAAHIDSDVEEQLDEADE
jgi:TPR repeat protein